MVAVIRLWPATDHPHSFLTNPDWIKDRATFRSPCPTLERGREDSTNRLNRSDLLPATESRQSTDATEKQQAASGQRNC